jgi:uncharacterized protein YuzB (UPF0349 family)
MNTLRFCENNMNDEMEKLVEKTKTEFSNVDISVEPCLGQCGDCAEQHIAMANDTLVTADTTNLLFERIKNTIGEREVAYDRK